MRHVSHIYRPIHCSIIRATISFRIIVTLQTRLSSIWKVCMRDCIPVWVVLILTIQGRHQRWGGGAPF